MANEFDYEIARSDIEKAKSVADAIVVSMHWGVEYSNIPSEMQKEQAQWLADQGVHIILGTHPHVLQPVDLLTGQHGNKTLVAYSLGNFVSGQKGLDRLVGAILKFNIKKTTIGNVTTIEIEHPQLMPTYNYAKQAGQEYDVIPLIDSDQAEYFETVRALMETYSSTVEVVEYITYDKVEQ